VYAAVTPKDEMTVNFSEVIFQTCLYRADETMFGQSSRFQSAAQLDYRRRVPLAAGRACYLASV
jgi:hypothetical protein